MSYGLSLKDIDEHDISELIEFTKARAKREEEMFLMLMKLLRWHAFIILKGFSKEGLKEKDLILPDEVKKKSDKNDPEYQKQIDEWFKKMDKNVANKWQETRQ